MNRITKVRVSLLSFGFGVALLFAPSAHAQAESTPDHFTEVGVEIGPGGNTTQTAAHAAVPKQAKNAKTVAVPAANAHPSATPALVAVADKKRSSVTPAPKR